MDSDKQQKQFTRIPFEIANQIIRRKSILELQRNLSKDAYAITNYFLETNFIVSKDFWQIKTQNYTPEINWSITQIIEVLPKNWRQFYIKGITYEIRKRNLFPDAIIKTSSCYFVITLRTEKKSFPTKQLFCKFMVNLID